jgi:DnaD/phage-associated family protein
LSGLIVGLVLRLPITEIYTSDAKLIAVIYADHAWQDGTHAHPAVDTVAAESGLSARTVQRYLRMLEGMGLLIPSGKGPRGTNQYSFPLVENDDGSVKLGFRLGGDSLSPRHANRGDTESGDTESGDTIVSPKQTNQNLVVVVSAPHFFEIYSREFGALTPMIADFIEDDCKTYPMEWVEDAIKIAVSANKRDWRYVRGILKNSAAEKKRPSLIRSENRHGNDNGTSNRKSAKQPRRPQAGTSSDYTEADRRVAEEINSGMSTMPG